MKHEWHNAGGQAKGYEVWHCHRCFRWVVPSVFAWLRLRSSCRG